MKIIRQSPSELVVQDSSLWISAVLIATAFFLLYFVLVHGDRRASLPTAVMLLLALAFVRRSTFTFSAARQRIEWKRVRYFRVASGSIPFSDVQSINLESMTGDKGVVIYRLAIATTSQGVVPMSDACSNGQQRFQSLHDAIQQFVRPGACSAPTPGFSPASASIPVNSDDDARTAAVNDSIRGLLQQGRKVDAILLVRQTEHLDLTEATFRVNHIENQINSEGAGD